MNAPLTKVADEIAVYCGELCKSSVCSSEEINLINFDNDEIVSNMTTRFDRFIKTPQELPDRIIDLIQIAAYTFCADRCANRGARDSIYNTAWGRTLRLNIPVSDIDFWLLPQVKKALEEALTFMTGDRQIHYEFSMASKNWVKEQTYQMSLFSSASLSIETGDNVDTMLFSGGLDSLAGALERLNQYPDRRLCLVNHMSNNRTISAQRTLIGELKKRFGDRVIPYTFECRFKKLGSRDETQRTRMFLFSAIAFAICNYYGKSEFFVYENGITSINLPKQVDLINARASRTTHPKTIGLLKEFYSCFVRDFRIETPFQRLTKEDIVRKFITYKEEVLIQSSTSCSSTRNVHEIHPHCGCCSQCIDRRFAMYAANLADDFDDTYAMRTPYDELNNEATQRVSSTLMFASKGIGDTPIEFLRRFPTELLDVIPYWPKNPESSLDELFQLFCRYKDSIQRASTAMVASFDALSSSKTNGSLIDRVSKKLSYDEFEREKLEACIRESVFVVVNRDRSRQGTGFVLPDYGFVTSHHVTADGDFYYLCKYHTFPLHIGTIAKELNEDCSDETIDYALYKRCEESSQSFAIGDSRNLKIGEPVKVIGYASFMQGDTYDLRSTEICRKTMFFRAPLFVVKDNLFHGESGGVVLDKENRIVGIIRTGIETAEEQPINKQGFVPIHLVTEDINKKGG